MMSHTLALLEDLTRIFESAERVIVGRHYNGFRFSLTKDRQHALQEAKEVYARGFREGSRYFQAGDYPLSQKVILKAIAELKYLWNHWKDLTGNFCKED